MNLYRLFAFVFLSMLIAILLVSTLNNFTHVTDSALADQVTLERSNAQTSNLPHAADAERIRGYH